MNVTDLFTREYEKMDTWWSGKNKLKTKPIQTQFKANTNPIQSQYKPKQTQLQLQNYTVFTQKALKRPKKPRIKPFFKKFRKSLRIFLHYYAYVDILLHISEDVVLCN